MALRSKKLLVTSGPTRAPLDAVRYITNKATGRLGALIAEEAIQRGARVTYVYGRPAQVPVVRGHPRDHLMLIAVETIDDLIAVFRQELPRRYDAVIHPMAVLDFQPDVVREEKTTSGVREWVVRLVPTPKVIGLVKELAPETFLVGFKLEVGKRVDELRAIAYDFLRANHADLVVANDLRDIEEGEHRGYLIGRDGSLVRTATGKEAIARAVVEHLEGHLR